MVLSEINHYCFVVVVATSYHFLLHDYRDLFIDKAVRNNRSKLAIANRLQER